MADSTTQDENLQLDGRLWKPTPGASATAAEFIAARELFTRLHREARWNPWVLDDRCGDLDEAMNVMEQWTRAEPAHRMLTAKQMDARLDRVSRRVEATHAAARRRQEAARSRYDADREAGRYALLEIRARIGHDSREASGLRDGTLFPAMPQERRNEKAAAIETLIGELHAEADALTAAIGDPEHIVDQRGRLPADRRDLNLTIYAACRAVDVRRLRDVVPELTAAVKKSADKAERAEHRAQLREATRQLETWLAVPELGPDDMCSECATPAQRHGWVYPTTEGPCWAWPRAAEQRRKAREMFDAMVRASKPPPSPPAPKPEPIAVVPSGLPIADVMSRLADIQKDHPDAEVRRGRANRWEIWPRRVPPASTPGSG